jgi:DNA-binding LytR/AlgR family response regulator
VQQYIYVVVVSAVLTTGGWALDRLQEKSAVAPAGTAQPATAGAPAFADRLPVKFRAGTIYAVSAEDHYLRVHTSLGETMVLLRLADAVRELASLEGLQTHRSWWVAKQGLADASRGDGKVTLTLKSGGEAPVSRTYQKAVKDAGWL